MTHPGMRFGVFLAPHHPPHGDPTLDLERDLELIERLDRLGFDEVFVGEHHSSGWEIIGSPEVFIAAAAQRTRHIRFGTGVISLPYHHPLMVAERMVLLDHLTRGRIVLGAGPGALPSDAMMMGLDYTRLRERMEESLEAVLALLDGTGPVDRKTEWFELHEARLQLRPYTRPRFEVAVTALASPAGPRLAGRHGLSLLSMAASSPAGLQALTGHYDIWAEAAREAGRAAPGRAGWRLVSPMHLALTADDARREAEVGIAEWGVYFFRDSGLYQSLLDAAGLARGASQVDVVRDSGMGVVGTPEDAIAHIEGLRQASGGFGTYLLMLHDWATTDATHRSLELFARHVIPHFRGSSASRLDNWRSFHAADDEHMRLMNEATAAARRRHEQVRRG